MLTFLLITAYLMGAVGSVTVLATIRYTPEQLTILLAAHPKQSLYLFLWFPAPIYSRAIGAGLIVSGFLIGYVATKARSGST